MSCFGWFSRCLSSQFFWYFVSDPVIGPNLCEISDTECISAVGGYADLPGFVEGARQSFLLLFESCARWLRYQ